VFEILSSQPISFWVVIALLVGGGLWCFQRMNDGTGLPMLAVLGTAAAWYVGDVFYNDYLNNHAKLFTSGTLQSAWWQVAWFLLVFLVATPELHRAINARYVQRRSGVMQLFKHGVGQPVIQSQLAQLFWGCAWVWCFLSLIALLLLKFEIIYYFFPFLGYKAVPWTHGRVGAGFDAFSILALYLQLLTASMFGVVAALATDPRIRRLALIFCVFAWPYFIFDRTRNTMLAMVIPAVLCWVFLRLRGGMLKKATVLLVFFLVVNMWMKFIIANRSDMTITAAFKEKGLKNQGEKKVHNEGLNMFEELCWVSTFLDKGTYHVNWGGRYFAELVNPIPRGLWPGKPLIGIDYAIARGQGGAEAGSAGVYATISTGFIGQGVVNFGRILGPAAAALLMSLWVVWLARLDLTIQGLGRLPLYSLGLILTFNLGRDITLITLYPFVFGALAVLWLDKHPPHAKPAADNRARVPAGAPARPGSRRPFAFAGRAKGGLVKRTSIRSVKPGGQPPVA
jgi:hypothetical protein